MKINKIHLILLAAIVWFIAGFNVLRIGLEDYSPYLSIINIVISIIIFGLFYLLIFSRMVNKVLKRIKHYKTKVYFWKFLDMKSFLIMLFMMTFGILIRIFNLLPAKFIAIFYTGLGMALVLASINYAFNYLKASLKESTYEKIS